MMNKEECLRRAGDLVRSYIGTFIGLKNVTQDQKLIDDIGFDDLDFLELLQHVEDEEEINIPDEITDTLTENPNITVGEAIVWFASVLEKGKS